MLYKRCFIAALLWFVIVAPVTLIVNAAQSDADVVLRAAQGRIDQFTRAPADAPERAYLISRSHEQAAFGETTVWKRWGDALMLSLLAGAAGPLVFLAYFGIRRRS